MVAISQPARVRRDDNGLVYQPAASRQLEKVTRTEED